MAQAISSGSNVRSASATGSADAFYHRQWEDHWWLAQETWASGGTYQNGTYDNYNYQYRWTKTWQGQGDGAVTSSASNHVTGLENGSESGWWTHTVPEGSGSGWSSNTSWGSPWDDSYDQTVSYPGFSESRYYGRDYGGGTGEEDFIDIAYVGDAFREAGGSSTAGMFPFAYGDQELSFGQAQSGSGTARVLDSSLGAVVRSAASPSGFPAPSISASNQAPGLSRQHPRVLGKSSPRENRGRSEQPEGGGIGDTVPGERGSDKVVVRATSSSAPDTEKSWWKSFKECFWSVIGYGAPSGMSEIAGGAQAIGEMFQPDNIENYMALLTNATRTWEAPGG